MRSLRLAIDAKEYQKRTEERQRSKDYSRQLKIFEGTLSITFYHRQRRIIKTGFALAAHLKKFIWKEAEIVKIPKSSIKPKELESADVVQNDD